MTSLKYPSVQFSVAIMESVRTFCCSGVSLFQVSMLTYSQVRTVQKKGFNMQQICS